LRCPPGDGEAAGYPSVPAAREAQRDRPGPAADVHRDPAAALHECVQTSRPGCLHCSVRSITDELLSDLAQPSRAGNTCAITVPTPSSSLRTSPRPTRRYVRARKSHTPRVLALTSDPLLLLRARRSRTRSPGSSASSSARKETRPRSRRSAAATSTSRWRARTTTQMTTSASSRCSEMYNS
jgi:hypothetical protein